MARPLSDAVCFHVDHYRFRCRVNGGGRPWIRLPAGQTLQEAQAMALEIKKLAATEGCTWDGAGQKRNASPEAFGVEASRLDLSALNGESVVYAIRAQNSGLVKIGTTRHLPKRLRTIRTSCGSDLVVLAIVAGDRQVEGEWHAAFAHLRQPGEWFTPARRLLNQIRSRLVPRSLVPTTTPTRGPGCAES